jgi:hypothetical protein
MPKKQKHQSVFEWLVEMGPLKALMLFNAIAAVIMTIALWLVHWLTQHR